MLFAGGILPGLLLSAALMLMIAFIARRRDFPIPGWVGWLALAKHFVVAMPAILTVVILLGGIYSGVFTPTEAAAVAALYAVLLAFFVYRAMTPTAFWSVLRTTLRQTAAIGIVIGGALLVSHAVAAEGIGRRLARVITQVTDNRVLILLLVMSAFLVLGMFLDVVVLLLVMVPLILPTMTAAGVDPVHLGVVLTINIMIGLTTPPMGLLLFIMSGLTSTPLKKIIKEIWPLTVSLIVGLIVLVLFPSITLLIPRLLGYTG
jgi:tripartite ATP-independent transporter DctM subunit